MLVPDVQGWSGFPNMVLTHEKLTPFWSLLTNTAWKLVTPKDGQLRSIFAVALEESEELVLKERQVVLSYKCMMDLRFSVWVTTNLSIWWDTEPSFSTQMAFNYWDQCEDQVSGVRTAYGEETAAKITGRMAEDWELLNRLGDMLTKGQALANNRDAAPADRVISAKVKEHVDEFSR